MMRVYLSLSWFLLLGWFEVYGQATNNRAGSVMMPSPDGASLGKYGDVPVSHFTGVPQVSIPIHTLKAGDLSVDIALSNHPSGLKVGEVASWVGTGWSLHTGGMITRTIQGIEDELSGGYMFQGGLLSINSGCVQHPNYATPIASMTNAQLDGEPDIFSFSVAGYHGKFYINVAGTVVQVPKSDLKITYTLAGFISNPRNLKTFTIALPNGTQYHYGDIDDANPAIGISRVNDSNFWSATDWKLKKIVSADGNYSINFTYELEKYRYPMRNRNGLLTANDYRYNFLEMESHRLTKITTSSNREEVNFVKGALRQDVSAPLLGSSSCHRLDYIEVVSPSTSFCKKFVFDYDYFQDNTTYNSGIAEIDKCLKLLSMQEKSCDNSTTIPPHTFEYYTDPNSSANYYPTRLSAAMDHWGYFNGQFQNKNYFYNIPLTEISYNANNTNVFDFEGGANRFSYNVMKIGTLKKITYPTGGNTTFEFEANTYYGTQTIKAIAPYDYTFTGGACSEGVIPFLSPSSISFADIDNVYFELEAKVDGAPSLFCCDGVNGNFGNWQPIDANTQTPIGIPTGFSGSCTNSVATQGVIKGKLKDVYPSLQSNVAYNFQFNLRKMSASLKFYLLVSEDVTSNIDVGGLRIEKIAHHDGINMANDVVKTYTYNDANISSQSSGRLYNMPAYSFFYNANASPCSPNPSGSNIITHFWFDQSYVPLYSFEGYHIGYEHVKEHVAGAGYTQYSYFVEPADMPVTYPYAPPRAGVSTGNIAAQSQRNTAGAALTYSVNTQKNDAYENSTAPVVKAYSTTAANNNTIGLWKAYQIKTRPFRLASVENYKDGITTTTDYTYRNDQAHLLPVETTTTHPDGTVETHTAQYPADLSQSSLLAKGMIHTVLEQRRYINSSQVSGTQTNYADFSSFPRPQTIASWNTTANGWDTEATFNSYDAFGNPTSLTNRGWQDETYTWDKDLLTQKNYLDFQWNYQYHANTALLQQYTEPNGLFTTFTYDGLSRLDTLNQYNAKAITSLGYSYATANNKISISTDYATGADLTTEKTMDGLGRNIRIKKVGYGQDNQDVVSQTSYDNAGRLKRQYLPGFATPSASVTEYTYEDSPLARPVSISRPAPLGIETISYGNDNNALTETLTNALGEYTQIHTDTRGRKTKTIHGKAALTNTTHYLYDNRDNLLHVLPDGRTATDTDYIYSYTYDGRNRLTAKKLPEKTLMEMAYNLRDLPTHHKDGLQPVVQSVYDDYGRVTQTGTVPALNSNSITALLSQTQYKTTAGAGFGQPIQAKYALFGENGQPNGQFVQTDITAFDVYHRPVQTQGNHVLDLANMTALTTQTTLNARDQALTMSQSTVVNAATYTLAQAYTYDNGGRPHKTDVTFDNSTKTVEETTTYDALDNPLQTKIGGNLQTVDYSYNANGFLDKINSGSTGAGGLNLTANGWPTENTANDLFAMDLDYQANGNISSWKTQNRGFAAFTNSYTYDGLQRLTAATNGTHQETFTYRDPLGNFSNIVRSDLVKSAGNWTAQSIDNLTFTYANVLTNRISSISDASNNNRGYQPNNGTYTYDANGNTTFDPSRGLTLTNNFLNLPSKFTKADGSRQEIIYDAAGTKWQEKTYDASGTLLGQKSYLAGMEFEGNDLSLVHHPTGFIRKLNSANHLSGTLNGNAQGRSITSTQKIGNGSYQADNQICLLPGFEVTAADKFSAEIKPQTTYQWQYTLRDHLGNQRVLFTDKDNDGNIRQSTDESLNEVLSMRNYSAFGLELGGSHQNINYQNAYKYTGKEENSFTGYYDFGARWSDPTIGNRFLSVDAMSEKYYHSSVFCYTDNNPIIRVDLTGNDWFRAENGTLQYDPVVQGQKDLQKGQKYIGDTYREKTKRGSANYREDGSILYSNQTDAYNRIWNNSTVGEIHEEYAIILDKSVVVLPSYNNNSTTANNYGYKFKKGNLIDAIDGKVKNVIATIHTHPDKTASESPSTYTGGGGSDANYFATNTPNKMGFVMAYTNNLWGMTASYNPTLSYTKYNFTRESGVNVKDVLTGRVDLRRTTMEFYKQIMKK